MKIFVIVFLCLLNVALVVSLVGRKKFYWAIPIVFINVFYFLHKEPFYFILPMSFFDILATNITVAIIFLCKLKWPHKYSKHRADKAESSNPP
jgi:hypothetical protein